MAGGAAAVAVLGVAVVALLAAAGQQDAVAALGDAASDGPAVRAVGLDLAEGIAAVADVEVAVVAGFSQLLDAVVVASGRDQDAVGLVIDGVPLAGVAGGHGAVRGAGGRRAAVAEQARLAVLRPGQVAVAALGGDAAHVREGTGPAWLDLAQIVAAVAVLGLTGGVAAGWLDSDHR